MTLCQSSFFLEKPQFSHFKNGRVELDTKTKYFSTFVWLPYIALFAHHNFVNILHTLVYLIFMQPCEADTIILALQMRQLRYGKAE